ncbi:Ureidoglycolate lyase [Phycisphaerae bacterium RAS1]|nr:Ureidoglycolate lyase [Phycisphaerae bacterium RAS1]
MRIARFESSDGRILHGKMESDRAAYPVVGSIFDAPLRFESTPVPIRRLLAPVVPPNIFAIGRNYRAHAEETGSAVPEAPLIFMKATTALNDPDGRIVIPPPAPDEIDYEAELAVVIGRTARNVDAASALSYALGFTCANDVSARDCQRNDKQWARAKGFDTFCPLGPWIVTRDSLNPDDCRVTSRLNGQTMQDSNTSKMIHSAAALISYVSHQFTLLPGTLILTGTPEGVGMARKPPVFLKPGDTIEVEVGGIGVLRSSVVSAG